MGKKVEVSLVDLKEFIRGSIRETVNGKIDKLAVHLHEQDVKLDNITKSWDRVIFLFRAMGWIAGCILSAGSVYLMINEILTTLK